jgi:thiol-disulfide isomerase/thioredoxin
LTQKRSITKRLVILVVGVWVGVTLGLGALLGAKSLGWIAFDLDTPLDFESASMMETNVPAPDFELLSTDGNLVSLSGQEGKVVVVNFWATWCGPCVQEIPMFQQFHEKYAPDLVILGVNEQENAEDVREFVRQFEVTYPVLLDRDADLAPVFRLMALPVTVFVDQEGMLRYHHVGAMSEEQFNNYLKVLGVVQ